MNGTIMISASRKMNVKICRFRIPSKLCEQLACKEYQRSAENENILTSLKGELREKWCHNLSLEPGSAVGEMAKNGARSNRKIIGERSKPSETTSRLASLADFFLFANANFFSFFSQCGAWSQAIITLIALTKYRHIS